MLVLEIFLSETQHSKTKSMNLSKHGTKDDSKHPADIFNLVLDKINVFT